MHNTVQESVWFKEYICFSIKAIRVELLCKIQQQGHLKCFSRNLDTMKKQHINGWKIYQNYQIKYFKKDWLKNNEQYMIKNIKVKFSVQFKNLVMSHYKQALVSCAGTKEAEISSRTAAYLFDTCATKIKHCFLVFCSNSTWLGPKPFGAS